MTKKKPKDGEPPRITDIIYLLGAVIILCGIAMAGVDLFGWLNTQLSWVPGGIKVILIGGVLMLIAIVWWKISD